MISHYFNAWWIRLPSRPLAIGPYRTQEAAREALARLLSKGLAT